MAKGIEQTDSSGEQTPPSVSDGELMVRYRDEGDQQAFEQLVHRFEHELYNYLFHYIGNAEMAQDVFQATFMRVHEKRDRYQAGRPFRPWLYTIATHLAIDALRREGGRRAVSLDAARGTVDTDTATLLDLVTAETPGPVTEAEEEERRRWTHRAVEDLPEFLRVTVILAYFQGLKYREVAEVLGIPLGTVKSRLHNALVKLYQAWKKDHPHSGD